MSSTHRGTEKRVLLDAYYTRDEDARACIATLGLHAHDRVWEPHAGGGGFVRAIQPTGATCFASDLHPWPIRLSEGPCVDPAPADARDGWAWATTERRPSWTVGNPPFDEAERHLEVALEVSTVGVGFLLRAGFLETEPRFLRFWSRHPASEIHTFVRRPGFLERYEDGTIGPLRKRDKYGELLRNKRTGGWVKAGQDSTLYAWFVWRRHWTGPTIHRFLRAGDA